MVDIMEFISDPVVYGSAMAVLGWAIERFAPQWMPFFAIGKKVAKELLELHDKSKTPNVNIKVAAKQSGLKKAAKELDKIL